MTRFLHLIAVTALTAALIGSVSISAAQTETSGMFDPTKVDAAMNGLLRMYSVPGVAIGLVQNGKVLYTKGYGVTDLDSKRPVTDQTDFAIGSISKSFTTLDLAQLVDAGKLDLDQPVVHYLPDFKLSDPAATQALTVRQVISHASGIPRSDDRLSLSFASRKALVDDMANIQLTAKPGEKWQYCNQNFVLAGYLVEQISGQTWEQYTQQHILTPLGMTSAAPDMDTLLKATDHASPYTLDVINTAAPLPYTPDQLNVFRLIAPAGAVTANVIDMAHYALFQLGDGSYQGSHIVSQKLLTELHTRQIGVQGMPEGNALSALSLTTDIGYGMGWFTETYQGHKLVEHGGEIAGFTANVTLAPDDQVGVVVLSNLDSSNTFIDAARLTLTSMLLGLNSAANSGDVAQQVNQRYGYNPDQYAKNAAAARTYKVDPAALDKLVGTYSGAVGTFTVQRLDQNLHVLIGAQNVELIPFADNSFLANGTLGIVISFKPGDNGRVTAYQDGVEIGQRQTQAAATYSDPMGRFTVSLPNGLVVVPIAGLGVIQTTTPPGIFVVAADDVTASDIQGDVQTWLLKYAQITTEQPINTRAIPLNGVDWTQFIYQLPDGQVLVVVAAVQGKTAYFVSLKAKPTDIGPLTADFNTLLLSFKITEMTNPVF